MSFLNHLYERLIHFGHSKSYLRNFKRTKFNLKYRKIYNSYQIRTATSTGISNTAQLDNNFISFENLIACRRNEAKRSIGVQVQSEGSGKELYQYCKEVAPIKSMFHYKVNHNHYFLIEFADDCSQILSKCTNRTGNGVIPVKSPFLWFKACKSGRKFQEVPLGDKDVPIKHSFVPDKNEIIDWITQSCTLSDGMKVLHKGSCLDELGIRLRFLTARQIEMALEGLFPNVAAIPFGSTVNGLGKAGCDLDLVLQYDYRTQTLNQDDPSFRLVQHIKTVNTSTATRQQVQRHMELLADLIQLYLPGCNFVKRILQARVPIVKFSHDVTGVDCDLSMTNMTGVYMSELLYLLGCLDPLARSLVFTVKQWAGATGLTNPTPGRWVTNFTLTLLTYFYLQRINRLPPIDLLKAAAGKEDTRVTEDIDCTFIRDLSRFEWKSFQDTEENKLSDLLKGFFEYYIRFDFSTAGISLITGKCIPKPDYSPLYIVNPLERSANVSKNVSLEEVERLKIALRDAAWNFETMEDEVKAFINLITPTTVKTDATRKYIPHRKLSVKRLFTDR